MNVKHPRRGSGFVETLSTVFAWCSGVGVLLLIGLLVAEVLWHGAAGISWLFLTNAPTDAGRSGGIGPMIISTAILLLICMLTCFPLGLASAIYLSEYASPISRLARLVRGCVEVLAGVPSIIFGLFGNAFFCLTLGMGYSLLSGGLTLACMVLPLFLRLSEEAIRSVPSDLRTGSAALGLSRTTTIFSIVLPVARPSIIAAFVLSIGRALAETAALIFTSGYVTRQPESLFDSGRAISVHIYDLAMNVPGGNDAAYKSATALLLLLLVINLVVTRLGHRQAMEQGTQVRLSNG